MSKVTLDKEMFKALASETRLDVLHALDERRKTTTEIAAELELNKATVHEHIKLLTAVGLIRKIDEGRKWIYHELTWDGRKLLHPDQGTIFNVLLTLSVLASAGAMGLFGKAAGWWLAENAPSDTSELDFGGDDTASTEMQGDKASADQGADDGGEDGDTAESADEEIAADSDAMDDSFGSELSEGDSEGSFPGLALALAITAFLLISLAIFLRKRK